MRQVMMMIMMTMILVVVMMTTMTVVTLVVVVVMFGEGEETLARGDDSALGISCPSSSYPEF